MRVIGGRAKRLQLKTLEGMDTRPTTDRIKETLFNMIAPYLYDSIFLDLFAGSGGIGIEALSRGAKEAVFVENGKEAVSCIKQNLKATGFLDQSQVMAMDVMQALRRLETLNRPFDIIFMDPPYRKGFEEKIIPYLLESSLVREGTQIIVETAKDTDISYMENFDCDMERVKEYKTNRHVFLRVTKESDA